MILSIRTDSSEQTTLFAMPSGIFWMHYHTVQILGLFQNVFRVSDFFFTWLIFTELLSFCMAEGLAFSTLDQVSEEKDSSGTDQVGIRW